MAVDERRRKALYDALGRRIGPEEATTLMELLPPVGWADVATKRDLDVLAKELRSEMRAMEGRLAERIADQSRSLFRAFIVTNATIILTVATIAFAAARVV
jgi:hypothetical protein